MPQRKQSKGTCTYCGKEAVKGGMTKHLTTCPQRKAAIDKVEQGKAATETLFHLRVQDAYRSEFWLDLEMRGSKSLKDLDTYLRGIWLECCGHLSQFSLGGGFASNSSGQFPSLGNVWLRRPSRSSLLAPLMNPLQLPGIRHYPF